MRRQISLEDIFSRGIEPGLAQGTSREELLALAGNRTTLSPREVLELRIPYQHRVWTVLHPDFLSASELVLAALHFAENVFEKHGANMQRAEKFYEALAIYKAWLREEATTEERTAIARELSAICVSARRELGGSPALAAAWAVVWAGDLNYCHAARMAAHFSRQAGTNERDTLRTTHWQVEYLKNCLDHSGGQDYKRDVEASLPSLPQIEPMDSSLACHVTINNQTAQLLQSDGEPISVHGYTTFVQDTVGPKSEVYAVQGIGKSCSEYGTQGSATYIFDAGLKLVLGWNVPYTESCVGDGVIPYFFAMLQGPMTGGYQVDVAGNQINMFQLPPPCDVEPSVFILTRTVMLANT